MDKSLSQNFSLICGELCNLLYVKDYKKADINSLIDELNTRPFKAEFFVRKHVSMLRLYFGTSPFQLVPQDMTYCLLLLNF